MIHAGEGNDNCRGKPTYPANASEVFFLQTCHLHIQYESLTKAFDCIKIQLDFKKIIKCMQ